MIIEINCTRAIIAKQGSKVNDNADCPLATAVRRAVRKAGFKNASVVSGFSYVTINKQFYNYPEAAKALQHALFDRQTPKSISFTLRVSDKVLARAV